VLVSASSIQKTGATIFTLEKIKKALQNAPELTLNWVMYSEVAMDMEIHTDMDTDMET